MLKQQNFFDRNIPAWKQVLFLSWPTIVELLLQTAVNYVDTAMVGSIGVNATAAVSITMSTIWLINGFMNAVGIGYSVLAAHSIGEGNYEQAKVIIRQSILAIGVAGIFLTLIVTLFIAPNLPAWMHAEKEVVPLARSYLRIIGMGYLFNISLIVCSNLLRCAGDRDNCLEELVVPGRWSCTFTMPETDPGRLCTVNEPIEIEGKNAVLTTLYISPLSLTCEIKKGTDDLKETVEPIYSDDGKESIAPEVTLQSGETIGAADWLFLITNFADKRGRYCFQMDEILDPETVSSVSAFGETFSVE